MWTRHQEQQQCGAQMPVPADKARLPGEATRDRGAQDHDRADLDTGGEALQPGDYPASPIEHRDQDPSTGLRAGTTPTAPGDENAGWDDVVQPEQRQEHARDDLPLPEGK